MHAPSLKRLYYGSSSTTSAYYQTPALIFQQVVLLQGAEKTWQFDIFRLAEATPGNTLSLLAFHLFKQVLSAGLFLDLYSFPDLQKTRSLSFCCLTFQCNPQCQQHMSSNLICFAA